MQAFIVGGAVRDKLLGLPVQDRDWVVIGATPEQMRQQGFRPVGKDFPVFLHPDTGEEYALARTERKTGPGYKGFVFNAAPDVTLDEDLARRDLTINAMAQDSHGRLIDPHGGQRDLEARVFRHVGSAFAEDPVRILRIARFAARFPEFSIAPETLELMHTMVVSGEADHLVAERVWKELSRGLMESRPDRMIVVLRQCGALAAILPEVEATFAVHPHRSDQTNETPTTGDRLLMLVRHTANSAQPLPVRWACMLHDFQPDGMSVSTVERASGRLRVPVDCRDVAVLVAREHATIRQFENLDVATILKLLERTDAFRRPARFSQLLDACACIHDCSPSPTDKAPAFVNRWLQALAAANQVDAGSIAHACAEKSDIPVRIRAAREGAIHAVLS